MQLQRLLFLGMLRSLSPLLVQYRVPWTCGLLLVVFLRRMSERPPGFNSCRAGITASTRPLHASSRQNTPVSRRLLAWRYQMEKRKAGYEVANRLRAIHIFEIASLQFMIANRQPPICWPQS